MKKFLIFSFIAILGLLMGLFFSKKQAVPEKTEMITSTKNTAPPITGIVEQQPSYQTTKMYSFPSSVNQYQMTSLPQIEAVASTLTTTLGFSSSPNKIEGSKGTYLIWNELGKTLIVGGSPIEVSFSSGGTPTQNLSSDTSSYMATASDFLTKLYSLFGTNQLKFSSETYIVPSGEDPVAVNSPTKATVFLANYQITLEGHPFISRSAHIESASVGVDAQNNILSFRSYVFPQFTKTTILSTLLSYDEAQSFLFSKRGILLDFSYVGSKNKEATIVQPDSPPQISTISNVLLGYYFSKESEILTPVYVFFGEGVDKQGSILSTVTVVSATK